MSNKKIGFERYDAPKEFIELAEKRTMFLRSLAFGMSVRDLAVNAYAQGMNDCLEAMQRREA